MTKIIYDKTTGEVVGEVLTNRCLDFDEMLDLIGAKWLELEHYSDPDVMINGKEYYCEDLAVRTDK